MRHIFLPLVFLAVIFFGGTEAVACTSAIIPGWASPDGRPLLWKHRDTDSIENGIRHFKGEKYSFVGLVNSSSDGGEVWIGSNTAGFAIMNTASYCLKDDEVPESEMDREGRVMYRALEICASLEEFEHFLDTLSRPSGVEANFGCIDAFGGAAYYETDNYGYFKRDVSAMDEGYCVVTNFSVSGNMDRWKGVERYITADAIFKRMKAGERTFKAMAPHIIMDSLSRSYSHALLGIDLGQCPEEFLSLSSGIAVDQDFIPRRITSASVVVQGGRAGESPCCSVIWAALGYPACAVMIPVPVSAEDHVPECMKGRQNMVCGLSIFLKDRYIFRFGKISNMERYMDLGCVFAGHGNSASLLECSRMAERHIRDIFECFRCEDGCSTGWLADYDAFASGLPDILLEAYTGYLPMNGEWNTAQAYKSNFADLSKNP